MKSWISIDARTAQASGGNTEQYLESSYRYIQQKGNSFYLDGNEDQKYTAADLRCFRECIDRLLPRRKA